MFLSPLTFKDITRRFVSIPNNYAYSSQPTNTRYPSPAPSCNVGVIRDYVFFKNFLPGNNIARPGIQL